MARIEMDWNLKKKANFFQVFCCVFWRNCQETDQEKSVVMFLMLYKQFDVREKGSCQIFESFRPKHREISVIVLL